MKNFLFIAGIILGVFTGMKSNAQELTEEKAGISFKKMEHDFGSIKENDGPVTVKFEFTNTGKVPLTLSNVKASCGCTTPEWTKEPVAPNAKGYVQATYNPKNRPGKFAKSITVTSNADQPSVVLTIKGEVIPAPVETTPAPDGTQK